MSYSIDSSENQPKYNDFLGNFTCMVYVACLVEENLHTEILSSVNSSYIQLYLNKT